jgi:transcriptional regulator with XRE-family HTH domain
MGSMQEMAQVETEIFRQTLAGLCAEHGRIQEIADAAKLSRVFLSRIINGHAVPTLDVAARIAKAAKMPLPEMLKKSRKKLAAAG